MSISRLASQNSLIGDGFGGRLWYKPYNYTVGSYSAYTVCGDSDQLYGWGANNRGELGDGTTISTTNPVSALGMTNVRYYSTGYNMGAIKHDSTGWVWGKPISNAPKQILTNAKFLDAGSYMCSFVKYDGTVWTVGNGTNGEFGNDSNMTSYNRPIKALNISNAVRVAVGRSNLIILLADKTVMSTGSNGYGGLGNGSPNSTKAKIPVKIPKLKKVVDIKGLAFSFIALDSFGDVYTWGAGSYYSLGTGSTSNQDTPVRVSTLKNIVAISGCDDGFHFMALDENHNCYIWGLNYGGSLGNGTTSSNGLPLLVATDVAEIMAGETFSYLVKTDGSLWAAGKSNGGSIWMNLKDSQRLVFTKIDPTIAPLNLCELSAFAGTYFHVLNSLCLKDSIQFKAAKNDSFKNHYWTFGDNTGVVYGTNPAHKYKTTGEFKVTMISKHIISDKPDTVIRTISIHDPSIVPLFDTDTMICGKIGFNKTPKSFDDDYFYHWNDGPNTFSRFISDAKSYILEVTDENGCKYSDTFTVVQHPLPKALFKADKYSMCVNSKDSITFTNLSTCKDSIVKCVWDFTESSLSSTASIIHYKYKKADFYPVFLKVYSQFGCSNDTIDVFDILHAPKPQFDLTVNDSCLNGNSITLKNNTLKDTIENPKFKWYFSEGFVLSNKNPAGPRTYPFPGKYAINLIYVNTNKCVDTLTKFVTIYPHPSAGFDLISPVCARDSIPLSNNSVSLNGALSFQWQFGDNLSSVKISPKHKYSQKGKYDIRLITTSPQGCKDSISKKLTVYNPPLADFSINDTIQCLVDNNFRFYSKSVADSGNLVKKDWYYSDNTSDTGQTPSDKYFHSSKKYTITHLVEDLFGCRDSISKTVEVRNGPLSDFKINDPSQCENLQNFIFTYIPNSGNDSIQSSEWHVRNLTYSNQSVLQLNNFPSGKWPIDLVLNTQFGCPGLSTKYIVVNPRPKAGFSPNNPTQCFNEQSFEFINTSAIASGKIIGDNWLFGDNSNSIFVSPPSKTYGQPGTFNITLTVVSDSGCMDTAIGAVSVYPSPVVDMAPVDPVCLGLGSYFKNQCTISGGVITSYFWDFGDNTTSDNPNPSHTYLKDGLYNIGLKVTSDKGCSASDNSDKQALVYPLPVAGFTHQIIEGDQNNNVIYFTNNTKPKPVFSFWNFGPFGTADSDSSISIVDTCTIPVLLLVKDKNGCKDSIRDHIFGYGPLLVFFPNSFSPNNDEINDYFSPGGVITTREFDFRIFNRWGEQVYQASIPDKGWDGLYKNDPCQQDVYTYLLKLTDMKGSRKTYKGTVSLIR